MRSGMNYITPSNIPSFTIVETDLTFPVATKGLVSKTARPDAGRSVCLRHITATSDQRGELISDILRALSNIDISLKDIWLRNMVDSARHELIMMHQNHLGTDELIYPESLQKLIKFLVGMDNLPENISVLHSLANLGLGLDGELSVFQIRIPPRLFKQLLANTRHETVLKILDRHVKVLIFMADPDFMKILLEYLTRRQLQKAARELMSEQTKCLVIYSKFNESLRFSDASAPYLITAMFELSGLGNGSPHASQDFCQSISAALNSELFTLKLCCLEVNAQRHKKLILKELQKLDSNRQEYFLACAFVLGQWELFNLLLTVTSPTILKQVFNNKRNILHVLATAIPSRNSYDPSVDYPCLQAYLPRYDLLFQLLPAETLANQLDLSVATPLLLLYQHNYEQFASIHISGTDDHQLVRARRSALIKLTASAHLIDCMQNHLKGKFPLNLNWFFEFLHLFKSMPPSSFKADILPFVQYDQHLEQNDKPIPFAPLLLQPVVNYFERHPDTLRGEQETLELLWLMGQIGLPVEYSALVLRFVTPGMQKKLLKHLSATPDDRDSLFIEQCYDVSYEAKRYYPWHLIGLGVGAGCAPVPDRSYSEHFLKKVAEFNREHSKGTVPKIPGLWEAELINSRHSKVYGRSVAFPATEVPQGYRRFKFLKQRHGSTEDWHDFIREQPQLDFFRTCKELGLESALLKPRGIYRMTNALNKLKACRLPDETLASIALEPDGSALLQVFDDEKNTSLYHHYPYETEGVAGLSVQASFDGLRLFARDAGRLWQHNFQAPDTLSSFHNAANRRSWVPTPFFAGQNIPGTLGEWNAQDYPNIAPAPVGMRDWADIRSFSEHTTYSFGMTKNYFTTSCKGQGEVRITELGKVFYGLVINWLRVRHDTDSLDYKNAGQMDQLREELVKLAADLFGSAYKINPAVMRAKILKEFPSESLIRAVLECGYWCDPKLRYVRDIKTGRFPDEVYPDHPYQSFNPAVLNPGTKNLTDRGIWRSSRAKGPNLGVNSGSLPLTHLDSLFWFAIHTGWQLHDQSEATP